MICTLCMSRKHRASHCPMKSGSDDYRPSRWQFVDVEPDDYGLRKPRHGTGVEFNASVVICEPSHGVRPDDTSVHTGELRNTELRYDPMLRTPRTHGLNVTVWGRR